MAGTEKSVSSSSIEARMECEAALTVWGTDSRLVEEALTGVGDATKSDPPLA